AATIMAPTVFTMGLAGIWHGSGFQYLVFGLLHAVYLSINHAWRIFVVGRKPVASRRNTRAGNLASVAGTFIAVLVAQAFVRAHGVADAVDLVEGMMGLRGFESFGTLPYALKMAPGDAWRLIVGTHLQLVYVLALLGIAWFTPNVHQILGRHSPALFKAQETAVAWMRWRPNAPWLAVVLALFFLCLANLHKETRFLYFQF
ncbi:MAG: MBOAT family O-acyltransferase, partial [Trinickia sp.]